MGKGPRHAVKSGRAELGKGKSGEGIAKAAGGEGGGGSSRPAP